MPLFCLLLSNEEEYKQMRDTTRRFSERPKSFSESLGSVTRCVGVLVTLCASLYVILSDNYEPTSKNWACATVGVILAYLLGRQKNQH